VKGALTKFRLRFLAENNSSCAGSHHLINFDAGSAAGAVCPMGPSLVKNLMKQQMRMIKMTFVIESALAKNSASAPG
jgi:hypothetical protein